MKRRPAAWTRRALRDLALIGEYIAADRPAAGARWVASLIDAVEAASAHPLAGRHVPEVGRDDREVFRKTYRIVYRVERDRIEVLTIFEGHRRFPTGAASE